MNYSEFTIYSIIFSGYIANSTSSLFVKSNYLGNFLSLGKNLPMASEIIALKISSIFSSVNYLPLNPNLTIMIKWVTAFDKSSHFKDYKWVLLSFTETFSVISVIMATSGSLTKAD